MSVTVFVSRDAGALSLGAEEVARAITAEAARRRQDVRIVRNGSRGMYWLEPLVEVATPNGRQAYGPVRASDIPGLFDVDFLSGRAHALHQGLTESIPYFAGQQRLTFARVGITDPVSVADYEAHDGFKGLRQALTHAARGHRPGDHGFGAARTRWRCVPDRNQVEDGARSARDAEVRDVQCR